MVLEQPTVCIGENSQSYYDISSVIQHLKTQKARGIHNLYYSTLPGVSCPYSVKVLPYNCIALSMFNNGQEWFARPCPIVPRHGFVESRQVRSFDEIIAVYEEARREDPLAELLLMPKLSGEFSGVATNAGVTWGRGNDGVTGGIGENITIPTPYTTSKQWNKEIIPARHNKDITDTAYLELVEHNKQVVAVQLRDGPSLPATANYIPKPITVTEVLRIPYGQHNLLLWEKHVKKARGKEGLVIELEGHALSSHFAVHGIALGIPVVTNRRVEVGQKLQPETSTIPELAREDYEALARDIRAWLKKTYIPWKAQGAGITAIATIHASPSWGNDPFLISMRAMGVVTLLRMLTAATVGEVRHWNQVGPGNTKGSTAETDIDRIISRWGCGTDSRQVIYRYALSSRVSLTRMIEYFRTTMHDFNRSGWGRGEHPRRTNSNFGGRKWALVSRESLRFGKAVKLFLSLPSSDTWAEVMVTANSAIHQAHNNGYVLNKFLSNDIMTQIAAAPGLGFMNDFAARFALGLPTKPKKEVLKPCLEDDDERTDETERPTQ